MQAELTWVPGSVPRLYTRPKTVTHPGTNTTQCRETMLIETNMLPLSQTNQGWKNRDFLNLKKSVFLFKSDFSLHMIDFLKCATDFCHTSSQEFVVHS